MAFKRATIPGIESTNFAKRVSNVTMVRGHSEMKTDSQTNDENTIIFTGKNGKQITLGDPLRSLSLLIPTLTSGIGTFGDKWKIFKLNNELKKKSIDTIFSEAETTTLSYLQDKVGISISAPRIAWSTLMGTSQYK